MSLAPSRLLLSSTSKHLASSEQFCSPALSDGGARSAFTVVLLTQEGCIPAKPVPTELSQLENSTKGWKALLRRQWCRKGRVLPSWWPQITSQAGASLLQWGGHHCQQFSPWAAEDVALGQWRASSQGLLAPKQHLSGILLQPLGNAFPVWHHQAPGVELGRG